jgi:uncharacterized protein
MLAVTAFFAAIFAFMQVGLAVLVIRRRRELKAGLGDAGGNSQLQRRIRAHGNFSEYVPMALLMLALIELRGVDTRWLCALGSVLLLGRAAHAYGLIIAEDRIPPVFKFRIGGMMCTFTVLVLAAITLLLQ